ncbi:MAG: metal ABC transporter substrate-binding protein [Oscillibacter sp.]
MKKLFALLLPLLLLTACGQAPAEPAHGIRVVATDFPAYDFARAVCGDLAEVSLLLPPGAESHSYEPTPADIIAVQDCDLFLYLGGESDAWVDTILKSMEPKGRQLRMVDCVTLLEEQSVEGMQGHEEAHHAGAVREMDEHVWTDPANALAITETIGEAMEDIDPANAQAYAANTAAYGGKIAAVDQAFQDFFAGVERPLMLFGDRFPLRYFAEAYDVEYYAAFPGCSTQTEPSAATIAFLTDKAKAEKVSTIYYIEFSNHLVADSIAESTGAQTALFHSCHNVSQAELDAGVTYVSLMEQNLETLRQTMG